MLSKIVYLYNPRITVGSIEELVSRENVNLIGRTAIREVAELTEHGFEQYFHGVASEFQENGEKYRYDCRIGLHKPKRCNLLDTDYKEGVFQRLQGALEHFKGSNIYIARLDWHPEYVGEAKNNPLQISWLLGWGDIYREKGLWEGFPLWNGAGKTVKPTQSIAH